MCAAVSSGSSSALLGAFLLSTSALFGGTYAPAPGNPGSTAIAADDSAFVAWASAWSEYQPGIEVTETFQTPDLALGPAVSPSESGVFDIVTLGRGGSIILHFDTPIADGTGADFAVFENGIGDGFLELAFVEVSSDGEHFVRFPNDSQTASAQGPYSSLMDPTDLDGLAGKYRLGYGTPFDLANLPADPDLDLSAVKYVRIVDIIGDGATLDSSGDPIYDPYPTVGSAGFDLDAIGALHLATEDIYPQPENLSIERISATQLRLTWDSLDGYAYAIEVSSDLVEWDEISQYGGSDGNSSVEVALPQGSASFFRVRAIDMLSTTDQ